MEDFLFLLGPISAVAALLFSYIMARRVLKESEGTDRMKSPSTFAQVPTRISNVSTKVWPNSLWSWLW